MLLLELKFNNFVNGRMHFLISKRIHHWKKLFKRIIYHLINQSILTIKINFKLINNKNIDKYQNQKDPDKKKKNK